MLVHGQHGVGSGALSFDGVNDYVEVSDNPSLDFGTGDLSIGAWVQTTSTGLEIILDKQHWAPGGPASYSLFIQGRTPRHACDVEVFVGADSHLHGRTVGSGISGTSADDPANPSVGSGS